MSRRPPPSFNFSAVQAADRVTTLLLQSIIHRSKCNKFLSSDSRSENAALVRN